MFGGQLPLPKRHKLPPWPNRRPDILLPTLTAWAHNARPPNSNFDVRMLHYKQRLEEKYTNNSQAEALQRNKDQLFVQYHHHFEMKQMKRDIKARAEEKLKVHEDNLERRRRELMEMLGREERQFYFETVDTAQRGKESKLAEMKERAEHLKTKRESDRLELVQELRSLQARDRNEALRPVLVTIHNCESKQGNLQQMRENESRREAEREIEKLYHEIMLKDIQQKIEREEQDAIRQGWKIREMVDTWEKQIYGKELLKQEMANVKEEDRIEIDKLAETMRQEKVDEFNGKLAKRKERKIELESQISMNRKFNAERQREKDALDKAFSRLTALEILNERSDKESATRRKKKEVHLYLNYLREVNAEKRELECQNQKLLEEERLKIEDKANEAKCKFKKAQQEFLKETMRGREEQLKEKQTKADEEREERETRDKLLRLAYETDVKLEKEKQRLRHEDVIQHRDDLLKQIQYNDLLRERARLENIRECKNAEEQDANYIKTVQDMVDKKIEGGTVHGFRKVLEQYDCYCKDKLPIIGSKHN